MFGATSKATSAHLTRHSGAFALRLRRIENRDSSGLECPKLPWMVRSSKAARKIVMQAGAWHVSLLPLQSPVASRVEGHVPASGTRNSCFSLP
jgi:hypothetical protein